MDLAKLKKGSLTWPENTHREESLTASNFSYVNYAYRIVHRTLSVGKSITVQLVDSLSGLESTKQEDMLLFVCIKVTEYAPAKKETSD